MPEQTVVEPPPGSEPWLLALIAQATGDEDGVSPEQTRAEQHQALVDRGDVSPKVVARYEALHAPAVGMAYATPFVVAIRGDAAWVTWAKRVREPPAVVRRAPSSGPPASSHTRRRTASRGPPCRQADDEPPLTSLTAADRRNLKQHIDRAARVRVTHTVDWRLCARCLREQEPEEFSNGSTYCKSCEAARIAERRRRVTA
jgi:hypothetical protein